TARLRYLCSLPSPSFSLAATASPETYPLSLHDALPILRSWRPQSCVCGSLTRTVSTRYLAVAKRDRYTKARMTFENYLNVAQIRSEEHTSELQSRENLVCRLLLEKKKHKGLTDRTGV